MVLRMIPHPIDAAIRVLDIGAGYGALAAEVLLERPNAVAICVDASESMLQLGRERNPQLINRMSFIQGSLESPAWLESLNGNFDAVVSSRALHHFTEHERRRDIFKEVFSLIRPGGCFINADNVRAPTDTLKERYRRAREEYLDQFIRRSTDGKTNLEEVRAATPSSYHGPHNNGYLEQELAWLKEAGLSTLIVSGSSPPWWSTADFGFSWSSKSSNRSSRSNRKPCESTSRVMAQLGFETEPHIIGVPTAV